MRKQEMMNRLVAAREKHDLPSQAQALFYELMRINSAKEWVEEFTCSALHLYQALRITDKTLSNAREKLIKAGLIRFKQPPQYKQPGIYSFTNPETVAPQEPAGTENIPGNIPGKSRHGNNNIYIYSKKKKIIKKEKEKTDEQVAKGEATQEATDLKLFEEFRQEYPGSKRGLDTEFENFRKKHKDYRKVIPLLLPAIRGQILLKRRMRDLGEFTPPWPNLQTWINNRRWEEEPPKVDCYD